MTNDEIKQLIKATVAETVQQLKDAGLLLDNTVSAYKKTEALLWRYTELQKVQEPYARRVVAEIDKCLAEAENEPYVDVIRLYYFAGNKNAACAAIMCCDERTCRRYRKKLVQRFAARLASADFIRELLTIEE